MKKLTLTILFAALLAAIAIPAAAQTAAASGKVASVNMKKLFDNYWKTKHAQTAIDMEIAEARKELKTLGESLDKAQADYKQMLDQSNDSLISSEEREKRKTAAADKLREINNSKGALEQFQRQTEARVSEQRQRMTVNLVTEIQKAITEKGKAGGYTLVMDSTALGTGGTPNVLYFDPATDITDAVLTQLNAGAPAEASKPAGGLPLNVKTNIP